MASYLNWRELELFIKKIRPEVEGLFVDRLIVPERGKFPQGYLKGEWVLRLTGRKQEGLILFSIRPRNPYLVWSPGKGPKASTQATRSPFDLSLSKYLKGSKLLECQTFLKERTVALWFSDPGNSHSRLGLILVFIPTTPEALLVSAPVGPSSTHPLGWPILGRSRTQGDSKSSPKEQKFYIPPDGSKAPIDPPVRHEFIEDPLLFSEFIEKTLQEEAFSLRLQLAEKSLQQLLKQASERYRQSEAALKGAAEEQDWQKWGDVLKGALGTSLESTGPFVQVMDYETEKMIEIPRDPRLNLQEQVEKFYQNARRKQRRLQEAQSRMDRFKEVANRLEKALAQKPSIENWTHLAHWERLAGTQLSTSLAQPSSKKGSSSSRLSWLGKTFLSKDGLAIWVGRNKDENLELTFKHARGNDLWMHVRGRPGAHVVIPLQPGKSAPLETLLDAANLVIFYSGGAHWGKTEIDYTFKKYVKRIKDSTEASYTNNKTLLIEPDLERRKKLLDQNP